MIGVHHRPGSFSDRWLSYFEEHGIAYKRVNAYGNDIVTQLADCSAFMWHWYHYDYRDQLFARQLTLALEAAGLLVFPSSATAWHFDDKVGQKYLLEAIHAPTIPTHIFYDEVSAAHWAETAQYPVIFKLRGGAGSANVRLIRTKRHARAVIRRAFTNGFPLVDRGFAFRERLRKFRTHPSVTGLSGVLSAGARIIVPKRSDHHLPRQKGYIYFQELVPGASFDDRIVVIGNRCFALRRFVRPNDFRASGSGCMSYDRALFPVRTLTIAHDVASALGSQALAFDFVYDHDGQPYLIEISYGFSRGRAYDPCEGFWDSELVWNDVRVDPAAFIAEDMVAALGSSSVNPLKKK